MFEESLLEVSSSPRQRWTAVVSITLQCSAVALLITIPLLHPEKLNVATKAPEALLPLRFRPPIPIVRPAQAHTTAPASAAPAAPSAGRVLNAPPTIPTGINMNPDTSNAPVVKFGGGGMGEGTLPSGLVNGTGTSPVVVAANPAPRPIGPVRMSSGVVQGFLRVPIQPVYPRLAVSTHTEGAVVIEAIISRAGKIESARVVSGPALLRQAALDAITEARYQPFQLNGQPTEVETMITVNFRLGS